MAIDGENDYRSYTNAQLAEALTRIDRERFPLNYRALADELAARTAEPPAIDSPGDPRLYTPRQIYVASMLGGPLGGAWFVSRNHLALANRPAALRCLLLTSVAMAVAIPLIYRLPDNTPRIVVPLAYSLGFYFYARSHFIAAVGGDWRRWIHVILVSIGWLAATVLLFAVIVIITNIAAPGVMIPESGA